MVNGRGLKHICTPSLYSINEAFELCWNTTRYKARHAVIKWSLSRPCMLLCNIIWCLKKLLSQDPLSTPLSSSLSPYAPSTNFFFCRTGCMRAWSCLTASATTSGSRTHLSSCSSIRKICLRRKSRGAHSPSATQNTQVRPWYWISHTQTHTHTHTRWFLWFTGTLHRRNVFYTVQTVCAIALHLPYT